MADLSAGKSRQRNAGFGDEKIFALIPDNSLLGSQRRREKLRRPRPWRDAVEGSVRPRHRKNRAARIAGPRHHRIEGLLKTRRYVRQDRLNRHVRACRPRQLRPLFRDDEPAVEARRTLSASLDRAPRQATMTGRPRRSGRSRCSTDA